ncbi:TLDc domain-containing protein [Entamoeba marina]
MGNLLSRIQRNGVKQSNNNIFNQFSKEESTVCEMFNNMKKWSNKENGHIIYDSDIDGDDNKSFISKVLNKKNMYFVHSDSNGNIFSGFISTTITDVGSWTQDPNCFLFSINSDGMIRYPKRFSIKKNWKEKAIQLYPNREWLCLFGWDLRVCKMGKRCSYLNQEAFDYGKDQTALHHDQYPSYIVLERLVVIEME